MSQVHLTLCMKNKSITIISTRGHNIQTNNHISPSSHCVGRLYNSHRNFCTFINDSNSSQAIGSKRINVPSAQNLREINIHGISAGYRRPRTESEAGLARLTSIDRWSVIPHAGTHSHALWLMGRRLVRTDLQDFLLFTAI